MAIISQKKDNRKSDDSNFYSLVLLSENLYPDIVRTGRVKICWRYTLILKIASYGYDSIPQNYKVLFDISRRNTNQNPLQSNSSIDPQTNSNPPTPDPLKSTPNISSSDSVWSTLSLKIHSDYW
jgi:hypothetical protein